MDVTSWRCETYAVPPGTEDMNENAYNASLQAAARVLPPTLLDYLR